MEYKVTITEMLEKEMFVEAESKEEALRNINDEYSSGEIIIDAECFIGATIEVKEV